VGLRRDIASFLYEIGGYANVLMDFPRSHWHVFAAAIKASLLLAASSALSLQ
jgi:phage-related minor tail protein